jgi:hypothetical protein
VVGAHRLSVRVRFFLRCRLAACALALYERKSVTVISGDNRRLTSLRGKSHDVLKCEGSQAKREGAAGTTLQ